MRAGAWCWEVSESIGGEAFNLSPFRCAAWEGVALGQYVGTAHYANYIDDIQWDSREGLVKL